MTTVTPLAQKMRILTEAGSYDSCGPKACEVRVSNTLGGVFHAKSEREDCKLFKTLLTNECSYDCAYCTNRCHKAKAKAAYTPEELARTFMYLHKKKIANGLFLSSGIIKDPDFTSEKLIETLQLLRGKERFGGYIHCKIIPGAQKDHVKEICSLADRVSVNMEAPNKSILSELSSTKEFGTDIIRRQQWVGKCKPRAGQSTQIILNNMSSDKEILTAMNYQYTEIGTKRMYYSAFTPVAGTPLEKEQAEKHVREKLLYHTDALMRLYKFSSQEIISDALGEDNMLPSIDPKVSMARKRFSTPIDVQTASFQDLIRIPGIGLKGAQHIRLQKGRVNAEELRKIGVRVQHARPFLSIGGEEQRTLAQF